MPARNSKKGQQASKTVRPSLGIMQNAIVLAPFHTLKKCFQNKLVDLYSHEKMKKDNRKMKMAEKQNLSFEYDIVELNQVTPPVKKEKKASTKANQKLRSPSYCQCNRMELKDGSKEDPKSPKRGKDPEKVLPPKMPAFAVHMDAKRRKLGDRGLMFDVGTSELKAELSPRPDFCDPSNFFSNRSDSRPTSRSKTDSSDTYSNPSGKDELLTGSLAISTTSFDSCLDNFDKSHCGCGDPSRREANRWRTHASKNHHQLDYLAKPNANLSRHLIMHVSTKNSDDRIVDFTDREPQTRIISSMECPQHLHPLPQRQSRSKAKNTPENHSSAGYYLRSLTPTAEGNCSFNVSKSQKRRRSRGSRNNICQVEAATQVEGAVSPLKTSLDEKCSGTQSEEKEPGRESIPFEDSQVPSRDEAPEPPSGTALGQQSQDLAASEQDVLREDLEAGQGSMELLTEQGMGLARPGSHQQPQDKEENFIFGPRNTASRLSESCKFSFGLNFVFSDDED